MISKRELLSSVDSLRDCLKTFDHATKCIHIPLPESKVEIGSTKSENSVFTQNYKDTTEHPNGQIRSFFRFGNSNFCVFSIKQFELHGNEPILTEIDNLSYREIHHLYKNLYYIENKYEIVERNQAV